ncbi:rod shape-determining protein MreC [Bacillaceae bacterium Marseille-Q3522]|nr:rod shape-determining protein MreC [Bacillaceae bacterium Marseille-Q3522]
MPQFFLNKRLIILLVSIIILVALIGFSVSGRGKLTLPEQFLKDTTGWVQSLFSRPAHYVADVFENLHDLQNTYEENKQLKTRLDELAQAKADVYRLGKENQELHDMLEITESLSDLDPLPAAVSRRNPDRWQEILTINKGTRDGVEANMAVISENGGLLGKIKNSQEFVSTVQLLSSMDPTNRVSAVVQGEQEYYGTIEGYDEKTGYLQLKVIPSDADIKEDQTVVTSGMGGVFPPGILIGKIVDVVTAEYGLTKMAHVKPEADFYGIRNVIVAKKTTNGQVLSEDNNTEGGEEGQ